MKQQIQFIEYNYLTHLLLLQTTDNTDGETLLSKSQKGVRLRLEINLRQVFFVLQCLAELKPMVGLTTVPRSTNRKTQTINNTGNSKKSFIAGGASHLTLNSKDRILREKEERENRVASSKERIFILFYGTELWPTISAHLGSEKIYLVHPPLLCIRPKYKAVEGTGFDLL